MKFLNMPLEKASARVRIEFCTLSCCDMLSIMHKVTNITKLRSDDDFRYLKNLKQAMFWSDHSASRNTAGC
jgi:hypothetical protein